LTRKPVFATSAPGEDGKEVKPLINLLIKLNLHIDINTVNQQHWLVINAYFLKRSRQKILDYYRRASIGYLVFKHFQFDYSFYDHGNHLLYLIFSFL